MISVIYNNNFNVVVIEFYSKHFLSFERTLVYHSNKTVTGTQGHKVWQSVSLHMFGICVYDP